MSYSLMLYYIKPCFATCSFCNIFFATSVLQYIFCNMFLSFPLLSLLSFPSRSFPSPVLPFPFPSLPFPFLSFPFLPLLYKAATATAHGATKNNGKKRKGRGKTDAIAEKYLFIDWPFPEGYPVLDEFQWFGRLGANLSQHKAILSHLGANLRPPGANIAPT